MIIIDHTDPVYDARMKNSSYSHNGAYYYSCEIVANIIPRIETDRPWVTVHQQGKCDDHAIVFIHNNLNPQLYSWMGRFKDLVLVCGMPETCAKVAHIGQPIYLPLSIDVGYVKQFERPKDRDAAYVGRRSKRFREVKGTVLPDGIDFIENVNRETLLSKMARYRKVYAVGRCALEAKALGCEVLPFDPRYPDPSVWKVLDNKDAAKLLQRQLDEIDGRA